MTEEFVTLSILKFLKGNGWEIVCFDFPQSGTGLQIRPSADFLNKKGETPGVIIPDILAVRGTTAIYMENKDRFVLSDFRKLEFIKSSGAYAEGFTKALHPHKAEAMIYGAGLPAVAKEIARAVLQPHDFLFAVHENGGVQVVDGPDSVFATNQ